MGLLLVVVISPRKPSQGDLLSSLCVVFVRWHTGYFQLKICIVPVLTPGSAPRPISSTPAVWRLGRRAASRSASSSSPGTAGTARRGHCSSPATVGCAVVRKVLDTTTGTPLLQVRAHSPLLSSQVSPFLPHSHLGSASPRNPPEGSSQETSSPISSQIHSDLAPRPPCNASFAHGAAEPQLAQDQPLQNCLPTRMHPLDLHIACWTPCLDGVPGYSREAKNQHRLPG